MRLVHYVSAGRGGLAFSCYHAELRPRVEASSARWEEYRKSGKIQDRCQVPMPKSSTDLRKVTCENCWREIGAMRVARLSSVR